MKRWWLIPVTILVFAIITRRFEAVLAALVALLAFAGRLLPLLAHIPLMQQLFEYFKQKPNASSGNQSQVETAFLLMTLDHDSGEMDGHIKQGPLAQRALSSLNLTELQHLYQYLQTEDQESLALLQAYIDRYHQQDWQQTEDQQTPSFSDQMDEAEALAILGLDDGCNKDQIIQAHRKLMQKMHPDRGGSTYLASKINQAKDVLFRIHA